MVLKKITPSKYQKKIYNFIKKGSGNAVINAKAGSGKTTTLIESMKLIPNTEKVLFVAFNKSIEQELSKKLEGIDNVKVKTYHGLGYSILLENYSTKIEKIAEFKYATYINNNIKKLSPSCLTLSKSDFSIYKNNIKQLVDFARFNLSQSSEEIKKLCQKYSINPILNETEIVPLVLKWGKNHINEIDYTDMIWLCIENDIETRYFKFDFIFIDEAQDSSIMQQYLIKKCYKRGTRFVAIGDEFQCINAFAGADNEAFKKFQKEPNTIVLDLPITYRCPKNIISFVKDSNNIFMEPSPNAIDGEIRRDVSPFEPKNGDMVLCRNTAHLVKLYMKYISVNKKCFIKGRSIGESLKTLALQTNKDKLSLDLTKDGVEGLALNGFALEKGKTHYVGSANNSITLDVVGPCTISITGYYQGEGTVSADKQGVGKFACNNGSTSSTVTTDYVVYTEGPNKVVITATGKTVGEV